MSHKDLLNALVGFYLDERCERVYSGRVDVWAIQNRWDIHCHMLWMPDTLKNHIIAQAKERAFGIKNSPLGKALE